MRFLLACTLLAVHLAFIRLTAAQVPQSAAIGNLYSKQWLADDDIIDGQPVTTVQGRGDRVPPEALYVRISPYQGPNSTTAITIVYEDQHLYAGASSDNKTVVWSKSEFRWRAAGVNDCIGYRISLPGENLCWFSDVGYSENQIPIRPCGDISTCEWLFQVRT